MMTMNWNGVVSISCTAATKNKDAGAKHLSSSRATVADGVLKLGYSSVIFVDLGVEIDATYYYDLLLSQQLLSAILHVTNEFIF